MVEKEEEIRNLTRP